MASISFSTAALLVALLFAIFKFLIYPVFLSPLSSIPAAHPTAPFSPLWILYHRYFNRANAATHAAHLTHGPVVRLGPHELSINCVDGGLKTVYAGNWPKHAWYARQFENFGVPNMFATLANRPHGQRKRLLAHVYSKSFLHGAPGMARIARVLLYERLLPVLGSSEPDAMAPRGTGKGAELDVFALFNAATMDFITAYVFGLRCATNHLQTPEQNAHWLSLYHGREEGRFWHAELPRLTALLQGWLRVPLTSARTARLGQEIGAIALDMCDRAEALVVDAGEKGELEDGDEPLVYRKLKDALGKAGEDGAGKLRPGVPMRLEIASEMTDHFCALPLPPISRDGWLSLTID